MKNYQEFLNESKLYTVLKIENSHIDSKNFTGLRIEQKINLNTKKMSFRFVDGFPKENSWIYVKLEDDSMGHPTKVKLSQDYDGKSIFYFEYDGIEEMGKLKYDTIENDEGEVIGYSFIFIEQIQ